jgi:hypothetical protein
MKARLLLVTAMALGCAWAPSLPARAAAAPPAAAAAPSSPTAKTAAAPAAAGVTPPRLHASAPRGAVVVAIGPGARQPAKALARLVYGDPVLGAKLDEPTARALVGEIPACADGEPAGGVAPSEGGAAATPRARSKPNGACTPALREIRDTVAELGRSCTPSCEAWSLARPMLAGLGLDLGAELVIAVESRADSDAAPPTPVARVLRTAERSFVPVLLSAQQPAGGGPADWSAALPVLRSLTAAAKPPTEVGPAPTRGSSAVRRPGAAATEAPAPAEEDEQTRVLSSPWFWAGLGVLVAAGVTVFALSRSSAGQGSTVQLDGRVSP